MAGLPNVPLEKQQGAVQMQDALNATAPPPLEPTPMQADEQAMQAVTQNAVAQNATVTPPAQPVDTTQQPQPPQPNMWRIPTDYSGVLGGPKSQMQSMEDYGRLWDALAADPRVDPLVRTIANSLLGRK